MAVEKVINIKVNDKELKNLNKTLDKTSDEVQDVKKSTSGLGDSIDRVTGGAVTKFRNLKTSILGTTNGIKGATLGFKALRVAIIATGIGALVVALGSLVTFFTKTQRGADMLSKAMAAIGAAVDVIIDRVSMVGDAFVSFFKGDFAGGFDKMAMAVSGVTQEIIRETQAAWDLRDALQAVRDEENDLIVANALRRKEIAKGRLVAEDETKAIEERVAALDNVTKIEREMLADNLRIAKEQARIKASEVALGESLDEDIKAREEALAKVIDLETQSLNFEKRIITRRNALIREGEAKRKADADAARKAREAEPRNDVTGGISLEADTKFAEAKVNLEVETARQINEIDEQLARDKAGRREQELIEAQILEAQKMALVKTSLFAIQNVLGTTSAAGKAVAIASALINTYQGITAELATKTVTPLEFGLKLANIASVVAIGFKAVKDITATKLPSFAGSAGGGNTGGGVSAPSFNVVGTSGVNQIAQSLSQQDQPLRAYVVGSDVTTQQSLDRSITETATLS